MVTWSDSSACVRCKHMSEYWTHWAKDYCKKDFEEKWDRNSFDYWKKWLIWCKDIEYNGLPIHPDELRDIVKAKSDDILSKSVLKDIDVLTSEVRSSTVRCWYWEYFREKDLDLFWIKS